ncbi:Type II secretion system (T2SS), protein F [uncultured archaeon]|nr:Type II secretion system (T2SS), protein F [uncultured archaeon]
MANDLIKNLERFYYSSGITMNFALYVTMFIVVFIAATLITKFVFDAGIFLTVIIAASTICLAFSIPIARRNSRIENLEAGLPDGFKHMAAVLNSGGTLINAISDASESDYGVFSEELKYVISQMNLGRSFDDVLIETAEASDSQVFSRSAYIISDAKKSGAGLSDILKSIAEDTSDVLRLKRERKSRTTMQVVFLLIAGFILSPFIFGFTISIVSYIGQGFTRTEGITSDTGVDTSAASQFQISGISSDLQDLDNILQAFISVQIILTLIAIGIIRKGQATAYVIYGPFIIISGLIIYELGKGAVKILVGTI